MKTATNKNVSANSILMFISVSAWHRKIISRDGMVMCKEIIRSISEECIVVGSILLVEYTVV